MGVYVEGRTADFGLAGSLSTIGKTRFSASVILSDA